MSGWATLTKIDIFFWSCFICFLPIRFFFWPPVAFLAVLWWSICGGGRSCRSSPWGSGKLRVKHVYNGQQRTILYRVNRTNVQENEQAYHDTLIWMTCIACLWSNHKLDMDVDVDIGIVHPPCQYYSSIFENPIRRFYILSKGQVSESLCTLWCCLGVLSHSAVWLSMVWGVVQSVGAFPSSCWEFAVKFMFWGWSVAGL